MSEITIQGMARNQLKVEENHALDILVNLPIAEFNHLKLKILELDVPGTVNLETLEKFKNFSDRLGLDLSENGINQFKNSHQIGNTGVLKGIIGPQTAGEYYTVMISKILASGQNNGIRSINQMGIDLVKEFEGLHKKLPDGRITAYLDPVKVVTVGYGHTGGLNLGDIITVAEAEEFLKQDLEEAGKNVSKFVQSSLTDNQFAALTSFVFNVGPSAFANSTMRGFLNEAKYQKASNEFERWVHGTVNGQIVVLAGLLRRRKAEKALFIAN